MKKFLLTCLSLGILAGAGFLGSCSDDEDFAEPTISLSTTAVTASPGENVSVTVNAVTDAGFKSLVVKKLWEGVAQSEQTFTAPLTVPYVYTVTDQDADHVLTLNFTVTDNQGRTASQETVITVELTTRQILLKYDWKLTEEHWYASPDADKNEIDDAYVDDVYRFNADGTYTKSIGAANDGWNDLLYNYCYYDLNDETENLHMSRTGAWFDDTIVDILRITDIDETKLHADVTYYGLDQLDDKFAPEEEFSKRFVAIPKTSSFDPYMPGAEDDATGPYECHEVVFEND